jgi:hypothetical protein
MRFPLAPSNSNWYDMSHELATGVEHIMPTSFTINPELLQEAIDLDTKTPIEKLVEIALRNYIDQYKRLKVIELFGTIDYDEDYNYKEQRAVR